MTKNEEKPISIFKLAVIVAILLIGLLVILQINGFYNYSNYCDTHQEMPECFCPDYTESGEGYFENSSLYCDGNEFACGETKCEFINVQSNV